MSQDAVEVAGIFMRDHIGEDQPAHIGRVGHNGDHGRGRLRFFRRTIGNLHRGGIESEPDVSIGIATAKLIRGNGVNSKLRRLLVFGLYSQPEGAAWRGVIVNDQFGAAPATRGLRPVYPGDAVANQIRIQIAQG